MAGKTAKITLGEQEYTVHQLNIGELEEVTDAFNEGTRVSFKVLGIALRRADPKVEDVKVVEADAGQIKQAVRTILELAGLNPPDPPLPGTEPA